MIVNEELFFKLKTKKIEADYEIGEILGEGAFGEVRKVTNRKTKAVMAMKTISKQ